MFKIVTLITWFALALIIVINNAFGSLTGFIFLSLCLSVLSALLMLHRPCHHLLSGIIV
jgi:hypothetical protein